MSEKAQFGNKEIGIREEMKPAEDALFTIETIQLFSFQFAKQSVEKDEKGGIEVEAKKRKSEDGYEILTKIEIDLAYSSKRKVWCEAVFLSAIKTSEGFDEKTLNNAVAMIYSYLRPIVAQMTAMAKAPSLDLPPLSFEKIELGEWE